MNFASQTGIRHSDRVVRPAEMRAVNASTIMRLLIEGGPLSRAEIAATLRLSQGAVTRIVADLTDQGLLVDGEPVSTSARGRPRVPVGIVPDSRVSIGVHIGVQFVHAALTDLLGRAVVSRRVAHDGTVDDVVDLCAVLINELRSLATAPLLGVGVISGGWVEPSTGILHRHELLGWSDVPLRTRLEQRTETSILVETSTRAHAMADILHGNANGHADFAHVFVGHVVEASFAVGGRVHSGPRGLGGALGNWTLEDSNGNARSAVDLVGDGAVIAQTLKAGLVPPGATFDDVLAVAGGTTKNAAPVTAILHERARRVGTLTAALSDLVGVSLVIFSSGVASLPSSIDHIRAGLRDAHPDQPMPEIRTETNQAETLTRAASTLVLTTVL
ncbi:ROK family transcriptional regulator [Microbacterium sp. A82]|uniref:ROK family transcriptional regulator n=1 Tax=unclassified Microbacterium TaxID=2609290 RepID=UPI003F2AE0FB